MTNDRILELYRRTFPAGPYVFTTGVIQFARAIAEEARREASTEPSDWKRLAIRACENESVDDSTLTQGDVAWNMAIRTCQDAISKLDVGAGALTDEAKDAALETMDHDQLGKLGQHYTNKK